MPDAKKEKLKRNRAANDRAWLIHGCLFALVLLLMAADTALGPMRAAGELAGTILEQIFLSLLTVAGGVLFSAIRGSDIMADAAVARAAWIPRGAPACLLLLALALILMAAVLMLRKKRPELFKRAARILALFAGTGMALGAYFISREVFGAAALMLFAALALRRGLPVKAPALLFCLFTACSLASAPAIIYFAVEKDRHQPLPTGARIVFSGDAYDAVPAGDGGYLVSGSDNYLYLAPKSGGSARAIELPQKNDKLMRFFFDARGGRAFLGKRLHGDWRQVPYIYELGLPTGDVRGRVMAPRNVDSFGLGAIDDNRNRLYAVTEFNSDFFVYDARTFRYLGNVSYSEGRPYPILPYEIQINHLTGAVYIPSYYSALRVYRCDPATGRTISHRGGMYLGVAVDEKRNLVYAARPLAGRVDVLDGGTMKLLRTLPVGFGVRNLALSPNGNYLYATLFLSRGAAILDTGGNARPRIIRVGKDPRGIHYDPRTSSVVVSCSGQVLLLPVP